MPDEESGAISIIGFDSAWTDNPKKPGAVCVIRLDQPTIVPNLTGSRPVDKVTGSLISWVGCGVQPASRAKKGMFDDAAPIWRFKSALGASDDPEEARVSRCFAEHVAAGNHLPAMLLRGPFSATISTLPGGSVPRGLLWPRAGLRTSTGRQCVLPGACCLRRNNRGLSSAPCHRAGGHAS